MLTPERLRNGTSVIPPPTEDSLTNAMEGLTPGQAFQRCINVTNHRDDRSTIRCKLGLWSVSGPYMDALREAKGYWSQYAEDGEYASLLSNPQD